MVRLPFDLAEGERSPQVETTGPAMPALSGVEGPALSNAEGSGVKWDADEVGDFDARSLCSSGHHSRRNKTQQQANEAGK